MANPVTTNVALIVPNTGADVDLWGANDINPNMIAIDGMLAGVQTIGVSSLPITLTAPAGFVPTPSGGPTQAQNRVLRFTGTLTASVRVTLPIPGFYVIDNATVSNNAAFALSFQGLVANEVIGVEQGGVVEIYNDGSNVRFVNLARVGTMEMWAGIASIPAWVVACTVQPFLLCDGSIYSFASLPALGRRLCPNGVPSFGGNGSTTFGVPDMRGRVPLAYDGTGGRITVAGCGINGQLLGGAADNQSVSLTIAQMPNHTHVNTLTDNNHTHGYDHPSPGGQKVAGTGTSPFDSTTTANTSGPSTAPMSITNASAGGGSLHTNVQPSIVTGIWVVKT